MKKLIALLLAAVILLGLCGCGGSAEPAPATTEAPTTAPTEAPTEEPTVAPTEAPTEPEPIDPATIDPIPVDEQLASEDTRTVTLGSLAEYEELLHGLGFTEVVLENPTSPEGTTGVISVCEPVSLTYNTMAFRLDFVYHYHNPTMAEAVKEDGWYMYGTKCNALANVSELDESAASETQEIDLAAANGDTNSPNFCYDKMRACQIGDTVHTLRMIYFPSTYNLYNYLRDTSIGGSRDAVHDSIAGIVAIGTLGGTMRFHINPNAEAAE